MTDASASAAPLSKTDIPTVNAVNLPVPDVIKVTYKGEPLIPHAPIQDFRGEWWFFDTIARLPLGDGRSGKVLVYGDIDRPRVSTRVFNINVFPGLEVTVDPDAQRGIRSKMVDHITKPAHHSIEERHNGQ